MKQGKITHEKALYDFVNQLPSKAFISFQPYFFPFENSKESMQKHPVKIFLVCGLLPQVLGSGRVSFWGSSMGKTVSIFLNIF